MSVSGRTLPWNPRTSEKTASSGLCRSCLPGRTSRPAATCVHLIMQRSLPGSMTCTHSSPCGESPFRQKESAWTIICDDTLPKPHRAFVAPGSANARVRSLFRGADGLGFRNWRTAIDLAVQREIMCANLGIWKTLRLILEGCQRVAGGRRQAHHR
jgi:hypothetical protein